MDKEFALKYLNASAPTMFESTGQKIWAEAIHPYVHELVTDNYGNVIALIKGDDKFDDDEMRVVIDAHADEIGFIVNHITEDGLIYPIRNGGVDVLLSLSREIKILTSTGEVSGYFGCLPIHFRDEKHKDVKAEKDNIFIDIGCNSKQEVLDAGVRIGDPIVYDVQAKYYGNRLVGKSLDDKIGGIVNIEVAKKLYENKIVLPFDLYIVNSVMEEVGAYGLTMACEIICPDVAIVFDVFFDSTNPLYTDKKALTAKLGDGVVIRDGAAIQKNLKKLIVDTAKTNDIKYTESYSTGIGGTNADRVFLKNIPTALIGVPLKYMHSTVETVDVNDVDAAVNLLYNTLQAITYKHDFRYLKSVFK